MKLSRLYSFPFYLLIGLPALTTGQTITLDEFLDLVKSNHPLFEKEAVAVEIEGIGRDAQLGARDWQVSSSPYYFHQEPLATSPFSPSSIDQYAAGASIEKAFWSTGGRLAMSWSSDLTDQALEDIVLPGLGTISTGEPKFYQNSVVVSYTQPLFQNMKGELDRLAYDMSQYAVGMVGVQAVENQEQFLLDVAIRFIDWAVLTEQKTIFTEQVGLMERQLEQARRKREANLVDEVDVLRALDAVRISQQNVVLIEAQWNAKQAELAILSRSDEIYNVSPEFDLYERVDSSTLEGAGERLRDQSRLLQVLAIRRQQLERQHRGFREITKPQLFLRTQVAAKGGDTKFDGSLGFDKPDRGVFLQFNYPLGNRTARANAEKGRLQIHHHDLETADVTLSLEAGLRNLLIQIEGMEQVLALNEQQIESARLKTAEELKRYEQGRGDLVFVIQSQDNEERAKLSYAQNAALYHGHHLRLKALLDELIPE